MKKLLSICFIGILSMECIGATKTRDVFLWCTTLEKLSVDSSKATSADLYNAALCDGYFAGFNDGEYFQYLVSLPKGTGNRAGDQVNMEFMKSRPWCEPKEGISLQQRYMMFNKYVRDNPDSLHKDAYLTILMAMKPHFPCK